MKQTVLRNVSIYLAAICCSAAIAQDAKDSKPAAAPQATTPAAVAVVQEEVESTMLPQKLSLAEAQRLALRDNPDLGVTIARMKAAEATLMQAQADYLPTVGVYGGYRRVMEAPRSIHGAERRADYNAYDYGAEASYKVFDGFYRRNNVIIQKLQNRIASLNHENARRELIYSVASAYFEALLQRQNVIIAKDDLQYNLRLQDNAEKKLKHGTGTKSDALNFEIQAQNADGDRLNAELSYTTAVLALANLMGVTPKDIPQNLELDKVADSAGTEKLPELAVLCEQAFTNRPDLHAARAAIQQSQAAIHAARSGYLPTVSAKVYYGIDHTKYITSSESKDSQASLTLNWNLFDGYLTEGKVAQATAQRLESEANRRSLAKSIQIDIAKSLRTIEEARQLAELKRKTEDLARQARDLVQKEYDIGRVTATRLNEAQTDYTNAQGAYIKAVINYWLARQNLDSITGVNLIPFREQDQQN